MAVKKGLSKQIIKDREMLSKIAFGTVVAFCVQILVYLVLLNIIPYSNKDPQIITTTNSGYQFRATDDGYYGVHFNEDGTQEMVKINGETSYSYENVKEFCITNKLIIEQEIYLFEDVNGFYKENWATYLGYDNNNDGKVVSSEIGAKPVPGAKSAYTSDEKVDNGMQFIYGYNMILLVITIFISLWYLITILDEHEGMVWKNIKTFFKNNKALLCFSIFMIWVFISSMLAYDKHRSFVGCYNLRDGYLSFMFYASVLVAMLIMGNKEKYKKIIINTFLVTATILAILTIGDFYELKNYGEPQFPVVKENLSGISTTQGKNDETIYWAVKGIPTEGLILSGIFNNTNHYAYYLTVAIIVAAVMAIRDKNELCKILYVLSFIIMTYMLIINNTFGSYIGVGVAIILLVLYCVLRNFVKKSDEDMPIKNNNEMIYSIVILIVFIALSRYVTNAQGNSIVGSNIEGISNDIGSIMTSLTADENAESNSIKLNQETNQENKQEDNQETTNNNEASEAGSGRWGIWKNTFKVIKKFPVFGCGLENMLYEMDKIVKEEGTGSVEGRSHNLILQLSATTGIPGMILYLAGIVFILFRALKQIKHWDLYVSMGVFVTIAYMISSMTGNSGFYTSGYFYIFLGLVFLGTFNTKDDKLKTKK